MSNRLKRALEMLLAICIMLYVSTALADREDMEEMRSYWSIVGQTAAEGPLTKAMNEDYANLPMAEKALALAELKAVTPDALLAFAAENKLPLSMARYAYYAALAECLDAELTLHGTGSNVQQVLRLFLDMEYGVSSKEAQQERRSIRKSLTEADIMVYSAETGLPAGFLAWLMLDDEWNEGEWEDSDDWQEDHRGWDFPDWVDESDLRKQYGKEAIITDDDVERVLRKNGFRIDD